MHRSYTTDPKPTFRERPQSVSHNFGQQIQHFGYNVPKLLHFQIPFTLSTVRWIDHGTVWGLENILRYRTNCILFTLCNNYTYTIIVTYSCFFSFLRLKSFLIKDFLLLSSLQRNIDILLNSGHPEQNIWRSAWISKNICRVIHFEKYTQITPMGRSKLKKL